MLDETVHLSLNIDREEKISVVGWGSPIRMDYIVDKLL